MNSYWNILWIPIIIGFIGILIQLCIICSASSKRTSQVNVINTPANNSNTITPDVPFVYNNPNPSSSTVLLSCTQLPFDSPPKYDGFNGSTEKQLIFNLLIMIS